MSACDTRFVSRVADRSADDAQLDRFATSVDPPTTVGKTERKPRGLGREELVIAVARELEKVGSDGATKEELVAAIGNTSGVSVQRALDDLRTVHDAKLEHFGRERRWRLNAPFGMPLIAPDREDLVAILIAQAVLEPFADAELQERLRRLVADLDDLVRSREPAERLRSLPSPAAVSATLTLGTRVDPKLLRTLLGACRRKVLRITYDSPWKPLGEGRSSYEIEPWALRVHDGAAYLRALRCDVGAPRTFRVVQIESAVIVPREPVGRVPAVETIWGDGNPAFGIDDDRGGRAVVRLRGAVARWVHRVRWHPQQVDSWIVEGELLQREVPYRSCREFARRLASVLDGIESIAPEALRAEVEGLVARVPGKARGRTEAIEQGLPGVMYRVPKDETERRGKSEAADSRGNE